MRLSLKINGIQVELFLFVLTNVKICSGQNARDDIVFYHIKPGGLYILNSMSDILNECWHSVDDLEKIRQLNLNSAAYEVGYLIHLIQNKYRKMLDRYYSAVLIGPEPMFLFELIILLEEIEHGYFQLEHIIRMLSQVERKYEIETPLNVKHRDLTLDEEIKEAVEKKKKEKSKTSLVDEDLFDMNTNSKPAKEEKHQDLQHVAPQTAYVSTTRKPTTRKKFNWAKYYEELEDIKDIKNYYHNYTKTPKTRWWWPIEYGWEIDYAWYF